MIEIDREFDGIIARLYNDGHSAATISGLFEVRLSAALSRITLLMGEGMVTRDCAGWSVAQVLMMNQRRLEQRQIAKQRTLEQSFPEQERLAAAQRLIEWKKKHELKPAEQRLAARKRKIESELAAAILLT